MRTPSSLAPTSPAGSPSPPRRGRAGMRWDPRRQPQPHSPAPDQNLLTCNLAPDFHPKNNKASGPAAGLPFSLSNSIFFPATCASEKIPFVTQVCGPAGRARGVTKGQFSLNFAKFRENCPHVPPLSEKARQGFFRQSKNPLSLTASRGFPW